MLRHLRSRALESLKTRLEKAVKEASGDGFEAFVESCGQSSMLEFDRRCEGTAALSRIALLKKSFKLSDEI